ncbi:MAG: hypothetical protein NTY19_50595 [Planctomycetota bacterium]|nr:hypothetical protein [Planctomycetota bacterium]
MDSLQHIIPNLRPAFAMNQNDVKVVPVHPVGSPLRLRQINLRAFDLILCESRLDTWVCHAMVTQLIGCVRLNRFPCDGSDATDRIVALECLGHTLSHQMLQSTFHTLNDQQR